MTVENINFHKNVIFITLEFRLKNIDKIRNYFIEEVNQNELMSKEHKNVCGILNYIEHLLILVSKISGCVSACACLVAIPVGILGSAIGLKLCVITGGI